MAVFGLTVPFSPCRCVAGLRCFSPFSPKVSTVQMTAFLLRDFIPRHEKVFINVSDNIQAGDLVLLNIESSSSLSIIFKHAAVYCGEGEVIHFQDTGDLRRGRIIKEGFQVMKDRRGKCQVLRKKSGVNPETFKNKVKLLMNSTAEYRLLDNNCINFALYLLDLGHFSFQTLNRHGEDSAHASMIRNEIV
ncbi:UNVERIFIED_CONTAM: hypothetical protein H355_004039 [Colinus virginianus]|nr:hypothetical protein H355_004039 [Colinus virginianus]